MPNASSFLITLLWPLHRMPKPGHRANLRTFLYKAPCGWMSGDWVRSLSVVAPQQSSRPSLDFVGIRKEDEDYLVIGISNLPVDVKLLKP